MANHCRITYAAASAACNAIVDLCDAGGAGTLVIYTGAEPSYASDAAGTAVATCALPATAFGAANNGAAALASTASDTNATGNASAVTYFRLVNNAGTAILQGTVGTSSADLNLNTTTIAAGSQVDVTALTVTVPRNQA